MPVCADVTPLLVALPQGLLESEQARAEVEAHLDDCPDCTHFLAGVKATLALRQAPVTPRAKSVVVEAAPAPAPSVRVACCVCKDRLRPAQAVFCAACLAPGHDGCFQEHGRCPALGCEETRVVRAEELGSEADEVPPRRSILSLAAVAACSALAAASLVALLGADHAPIVVHARAPLVRVEPQLHVPAPVVRVEPQVTVQAPVQVERQVTVPAPAQVERPVTPEPPRRATRPRRTARLTDPGVFQVTQRPPAVAGQVTIDLVTGEVLGQHPALKVTTPPRDTDRNGWHEAVLSLDLEGYAGIAIEAEYGDVVPAGMTLDLGDSRTNNGFAGDSGTQSNDAESQVYGRNLTVWGNDYTQGERKLTSFERVIEAGGTLQLEAGDGFLRWRSDFGGEIRQDEIRSAFLYALAGQADREGPVDHQLYLGLNRDISSGSRRGVGLARVTLRFSPE